MKCGACREHHPSVDDVRRCYANKLTRGQGSQSNGDVRATPGSGIGRLVPTWSEINDELTELSRQQIVSTSDVNDEVIDPSRQRSEDIEDALRRRSFRPFVRIASDGPLRSCEECGQKVVNCTHLAQMWCNQCRKYTSKPGLHQNCVPGQWK